jgi:elongation factor G
MVLGMDAEGKYTTLRAKAPLAEMNRYCTALSSLTSGRGTFTMTFSGYELVPTDVQQALLKAYDEQSTSDALPPPRKNKRQLLLNTKEDACIGHPLFLLHNKPGRNALLVMFSCRKFCDSSLENR